MTAWMSISGRRRRAVGSGGSDAVAGVRGRSERSVGMACVVLRAEGAVKMIADFEGTKEGTCLPLSQRKRKTCFLDA